MRRTWGVGAATAACVCISALAACVGDEAPGPVIIVQADASSDGSEPSSPDTGTSGSSDTGTGNDTGASGDTGTGSDTGAGSDTGTGEDTGTAGDSGNDTGADDSGIADTGVEDTGVADTGVTDTGVDTGTDSGLDAGVDTGTDAGVDAGPTDSGVDTGTDSGTDAGVTDSGVDSGADGGCDPLGTFTSHVVVGGLPAALSSPARFTTDELTAYFMYSPDGASPAQIYEATRGNTSLPFSGVTPVGGVAMTNFVESNPSISPDGTTLYFQAYDSTADAAQRNDDIWRSALDVDAGTFGTPAIVTAVNSAQIDRFPFLTTDGSLWFSSSRPGTGVEDLYRASPKGVSFDPPQVQTGINDVTVTESFPVLSADRLTIYFTRNLPDGAGGFQTDIFVAHRAAGDAFANPALVGEIDTSANDERSAWLSADSCRLYVAFGDTFTMNVWSR